ncbi:MAG TPA: hypothetical protein VD866_06145 [Urbifossiella sp.]|nr:hypothetical protein [Urbifossiella sp.]
MVDPNVLAESARQVAEFAAAAAAASGDDPAAAAARAAVVRRWPNALLLLGGPDPGDAELAAALTAAADRTRGRPSGLFAGVRKYLGGPETVTAELLTRAAERLSAGGLAADLARLVREWEADDAVARLTDLQQRLADGPAGDLLKRLSGRSATIPEFASLGAPARAAARTAHLVASDLAALTSDRTVWKLVRDWVTEWFQKAGVDGELSGTAPKTAAADGDEVYAFDLAATPGKRVVLRVRPEPARPRSAVAAWADLPPPPAPAPDWLTAFHADARRADADPTLTPPDPDAVKPKFTHWVKEEDEGRKWFHELLSGAASNPAGAAAVWWRRLRSGFWCRAYPDLDPDAADHAPTWPADMPLGWPTAASVRSQQPPDTVVGVEQYAATPELARVTISDGPSEPDSTADRFHRLYEAVGRREDWWGGGWWRTARELTRTGSKAGDRPGELALGWINLLADAPGDDPRVEALGRWAEGFGLTLVRPTDVAGGPRPGLTVRAVFADAAAGAFVRGHGYGLVAGEQVMREAVAEVSLGTAPAGFEALEAAAGGLPAGHPLRDRVTALREAIRGGYLMEASLRLYVDCWAEPGAPAKAAAAFTDVLTRFLEAAYGLAPFFPISLHDHPDGWVTVVPGSRSTTGTVRKVRRPGLKDDHGNLRIPALVEVD